MAWNDEGFDENMQRTPSPNAPDGEQAATDSPFFNPSDFNDGDIAKSLDGSLVIDLQKGIITKDDGRIVRTILPNLQIFVAADGSGDFADLQAAINYVSQNGGGTISVKAGTYRFTAPLTTASNIAIIGEGIGNTVLDFTPVTSFPNSAAIEVIGKQLDQAFTNSLTNGSSTITGVGTTWTRPGIQQGDSVVFYGEPLQIDHVVSDTALALVNPYRGASNSFSGGYIYRSVKNFRLSGLTIKGANSSGVRLRYCENIEIDNCEIYGFQSNLQYAGIKIDLAFNTLITQNFIHDNQRGILIGDILYPSGLTAPTVGSGTVANLQSITILANQVTNNVKDGIRAELAGLITISNNSCRGNGLAGVFLRMCTDCQILGNTCNYNIHGIMLWSYEGGPQQSMAANMQNTNVVGNIISNNSTYGVYIRASISSTVSGQVNYPQFLFIIGNQINSNSTNGIILNGATEGFGDNAETS